MRYTTVIDITELTEVYRNVNARLLYLHMSLKAGYHDDDRDKLEMSIRDLAAGAGLTLAATRHALKVLQAAKLISRNARTWNVLKFFVADAPTPRRQPTKAEKASATAAGIGKIGEQADREAAEYRERLTTAVREMTREELKAWLEELEDGKNRRHHGAYLNPTQANIAWLKEVIKRK